MDNLLSRNNIMMVATLAILYMVYMGSRKPMVSTTES